jgi:hypothetical protein
VDGVSSSPGRDETEEHISGGRNRAAVDYYRPLNWKVSAVVRSVTYFSSSWGDDGIEEKLMCAEGS